MFKLKPIQILSIFFTPMFIVITGTKAMANAKAGSSTSSKSRASIQQCWKSEVNPISLQFFASNQEYQKALSEWDVLKPRVPNLLNLGLAYMLYEKEKQTSLGLGSDKMAHCFMGCRISTTVNYQTAVYVGWLKESKDLKDCKSNTHFEPLDYEVTRLGARAGANQYFSMSQCASFCESL